jgi:hypothetical protein
MGGRLLAVIAVALVQGTLLRWLHHLADRDAGPWSELSFLLPAYACTVGVPLAYYLLRSKVRGAALAMRLILVTVGLAGTAFYVGWVNGPVGSLYPSASGSIFLYFVLAVLGWFISLPFLSLGLRGASTADGYTVLFDEAWRLAITLAFAALFTQVFWALLSLFVALFESIHITWPKQIIWTRRFAYPATCVAASFAIGLTDVQPEMFRALRRLLLTVLRWLTVLASAIVLLFLGAVVVEGVTALWKTNFASAGLISTSLMLVTLYNAVYQDGREPERLPRALAWPVRAALIVGPALAGLAFWALALRIRQHGVSEDRLQALVVVTILAGYLVGYALVAAFATQAPFAVRHVNVVMALAIVATLVAIHSPLADLKRVATAAQLRRMPVDGDKFDFRYLRFDLGRHGLRALQDLSRSGTRRVATLAERALAEANTGGTWPFPGQRPLAEDRTRFATRFEVYPDGTALPADLIDVLFGIYKAGSWQLPCIDRGAQCMALLVDLDHDGREEVVVPVMPEGTVYARESERWIKVGRLQPGHYQTPESLRPELLDQKVQSLPPSPFGGLRIGENEFSFMPCAPQEAGCVARQ